MNECYQQVSSSNVLQWAMMKEKKYLVLSGKNRSIEVITDSANPPFLLIEKYVEKKYLKIGTYIDDLAKNSADINKKQVNAPSFN